MILRGHRTNDLETRRGRLVLHKCGWLRQATPKGVRGAADVVSLLDPSDSSDPGQPVTTPSTLDRALADFEVEETTGPPLSEARLLGYATF